MERTDRLVRHFCICIDRCLSADRLEGSEMREDASAGKPPLRDGCCMDRVPALWSAGERRSLLVSFSSFSLFFLNVTSPGDVTYFEASFVLCA